MTKSELVGYVRKSNSGNALKLNILKSALENAETVEGKDGTEYVSLIMNLSKIKMIIGDEHEVTSVCQLTEDDGNDPIHVDVAKTEEVEERETETETPATDGLENPEDPNDVERVRNTQTDETAKVLGWTGNNEGATVQKEDGSITWWKKSQTEIEA